VLAATVGSCRLYTESWQCQDSERTAALHKNGGLAGVNSRAAPTLATARMRGSKSAQQVAVLEHCSYLSSRNRTQHPFVYVQPYGPSISLSTGYRVSSDRESKFSRCLFGALI
jgi:hypothetical protein